MLIRLSLCLILTLFSIALQAAPPSCDGKAPGNSTVSVLDDEIRTKGISYLSDWKVDESVLRRKYALGKRAGLQESEVFSIWTYSLHMFETMNSDLWRGKELSLPKNYLSLCSALSKLPKYDGTVYRVSSLSEDYLDEYYYEGAAVEFKGFTSTSASIYGVRDYITKSNREFNVLMIIKTKSGSLIKHFGMNPAEEEVLLPAGTQFRVTRVTEISALAQAKLMAAIRLQIELEEISTKASKK